MTASPFRFHGARRPELVTSFTSTSERSRLSHAPTFSGAALGKSHQLAAAFSSKVTSVLSDPPGIGVADPGFAAAATPVLEAKFDEYSFTFTARSSLACISGQH
jgi:hypothetical protein